MKVSLSRYRNVGTVGSSKYVTLPNGFSHREFVKKYNFTFAYLNQSISEQYSNLGSNDNNTKLISTLDSRFDPLVQKVNGDQISIDGANYRINSVTKDDSEAMITYRISISLKSGF